MTEIKKTKDYFIFKKHPNNRDIDQSNLNRIKNSLSVKNLMAFRPILVNQSMEVIDGQHRLEAAKQLGIEIYYQIHKDSNEQEIILINANQKKWMREDYLNYHVSKGNVEYLKVRDYCEKHAMGLPEFLRITPNYYYSGGGRRRDPFVLGEYKFPQEEKLEALEKTTQGYKNIFEVFDRLFVTKPNFLKSALFKRAIISFLALPGVDLDVFIAKLTYKVESMHPCAGISDYISMFTGIYNWRNNNPIEK